MNPYAETALFIANNSKHCFLDLDRNFALVLKWAKKNFSMPSWREPVFPDSDENIIEFLGIVNSINFCFTDFRTGKKFDVEYPKGSGKIWNGSFGMAACFKRALDDGLPILDPHFLAELTENRAKCIFRHLTTPIPMLKERVSNLRNVGKAIERRNMNFQKNFEVCKYKFLDIVETIVNLFASYEDVSQYRGRCIKFYKRAQLFPMVYHGRAISSDGVLKPIADPENFGPIADYEVPKVLRGCGVLRYSKKLAAKIDNGEIIPKDSPEEIEIRAQTIIAMSRLLENINCLKRGWQLKEITMAELDYAIWSMGSNTKFRSRRHHCTYTTAY